MKTKSLLSSLSTILLAAVLVAGCVTPLPPPSVEAKAYAVTDLVAFKVLLDHPDWKPQFAAARDDLKTIEASPNGVTLPQILEIVQRLPVAELQSGNTQLYIRAGLIFFQDELGALTVAQPDQVKSAVTGMRRALDDVLK